MTAKKCQCGLDLSPGIMCMNCGDFIRQHITINDPRLTEPTVWTVKGKYDDNYDLCEPNNKEEERDNPTIEIKVIKKDIVNPTHNPDIPTTKEEIDRMWEITKGMCK